MTLYRPLSPFERSKIVGGRVVAVVTVLVSTNDRLDDVWTEVVMLIGLLDDNVEGKVDYHYQTVSDHDILPPLEG